MSWATFVTASHTVTIKHFWVFQWGLQSRFTGIGEVCYKIDLKNESCHYLLLFGHVGCFRQFPDWVAHPWMMLPAGTLWHLSFSFKTTALTWTLRILISPIIKTKLALCEMNPRSPCNTVRPLGLKHWRRRGFDAADATRVRVIESETGWITSPSQC